MGEVFTQLGVGGIIAVMVIKEFVAYTRLRREKVDPESESREESVDYRKDLVTKELCAERHLNLNNMLLDMTVGQRDMHEKINAMCTSIQSIKFDVAKIKENGKKK